MKRSLSILAAAALTMSASAQLPQPPVAKKVRVTDTLHGDVRVDDYAWMKVKTNPGVVEYLEAENAYMSAVTKPNEQFQETIYQEIISRTKLTDLSVPYRKGNYFYYSRTLEGKQYPIHCRKKGSLEAPEEILLEMNLMAEGLKFLGLGVFRVSDDGNLLAYSLDTTGYRVYDLSIKDLRTGELLSDRIGPVVSFEWAKDNRTCFYVREDAAKRPYKMFRHVIGNPSDDPLYEEKDALYRLWLGRSSDRSTMMALSASATTTEYRTLSAAEPRGEFLVLFPRENEHEYYADIRDGEYFIRTNKNAKNFRLVTAPVANPTQWSEFLPHRPSVKLEHAVLFKQFAVFYERENGLTKLRVYDFAKKSAVPIKFPEPVYMAAPGQNEEYTATTFRYSYQSFITPSSIFDYDVRTGKSQLMKQTEVLGGYDPKQYVSERIFAKSSDGTRVPISLVYKKGTKKDGTHPLWLYGYGSYGSSLPIGFSIPRLSLLDRGVIYAQAHIRGGGDMGEQWYDDGKMMKKMNTFTDFIDCADHLVNEKYTSRDRLAIQGGSAGGLLIGAVVNMRPDICKVAHLAVPFVDVINTMLDESLPLTVQEFLEWGNPKKKEEYEYLKKYCPYTNIRQIAYPTMLITTSFNDSQVGYWEPAKYTAKMRVMRSDKNVLVFKCNMGAGHGGASGRYDAFKETAFNYAFVMSQLGIVK